jgi:hypothetical protein
MFSRYLPAVIEIAFAAAPGYLEYRQLDYVRAGAMVYRHSRLRTHGPTVC